VGVSQHVGWVESSVTDQAYATHFRNELACCLPSLLFGGSQPIIRGLQSDGLRAINLGEGPNFNLGKIRRYRLVYKKYNLLYNIIC
jgi:hypothetical protein